MKESPIPFSTEMVQAVLNLLKTQTRRTRGLKEFNEDPTNWICGDLYINESGELIAPFYHTNREKERNIKCPYGKPGDRVGVKETFALSSTRWRYKADSDWTIEEKEMGEDAKWKSSRFMPKAAARIWLQIEEIRVERLHDITEEDAIAEGVGAGFQMNAGWPDYQFIKNGVCTLTQDTAIMSFASLWDSINDKPGSMNWHSNPWVWVITFKIISTTGKPNLESEI